MNTIYKIITGIFIICPIVSCENNNSVNNDDLVVLEGYLYQGEIVDSIHLTKTVSFESGDTIYPPVTDAEVMIDWQGNSYELQNIGGGYYGYQGMELQVVEGQSYSITIHYKNQTISSGTVVPQKPESLTMSDTTLYYSPPSEPGPGSGPLDTSGIRITWDDPNNSYYFALIESTDPDAADIHDGDGDIPRPGRVFSFRTLPFKGNEYIIRAMALEKYDRHRVKIYRVTQEYADLYEDREQDSRSLSEPLTNVVNGLGIFTAFSYSEGYFRVEEKEE